MSGIKKGHDPRKTGSGAWLTIEANSSVDVTILCDCGDILSCDQVTLWVEEGRSPQWVYTGSDDPMHALGLEKRYRAFLPVLHEGQQKIWSMGKQAHTQLFEIEEANGSLSGQIIRIKKTGVKLSTRYSLISRGRSKEKVPELELDVIELLGPTESEEVREMLEKRFEIPFDDIVDLYGNAKKSAKPSSKKKSYEITEEDEDFSDLT